MGPAAAAAAFIMNERLAQCAHIQRWRKIKFATTVADPKAEHSGEIHRWSWSRAPGKMLHFAWLYSGASLSVMERLKAMFLKVQPVNSKGS